MAVSASNLVLHADPTAELTPLKAGKIAQNDEEDMGITY
jgi:NH3-dependent NAD+ synthetase